MLKNAVYPIGMTSFLLCFFVTLDSYTPILQSCFCHGGNYIMK